MKYMWLCMALAFLLIVLAKEKGIENVAEAVAFAAMLFILLMEVFQYL
ncbi:hypothetical protein [Blautia sp. An249]|nr:hypothetical protein [Blautia sp. An249]